MIIDKQQEKKTRILYRSIEFNKNKKCASANKKNYEKEASSKQKKT